MDNLSGIRKISQRLLICLWAVLIINPVFNAVMWFGAVFDVNNEFFMADFPYYLELPLDIGPTLLGFAVSNITVVVASMIVWQLITLFRLYRDGKIFAMDNVNCYHNIANYIILYVFAGFAVGLLMGPALTYNLEETTVSFGLTDSDITLLIIGIMIRLIAKVMREAKGLYDEQTLTI